MAKDDFGSVDALVNSGSSLVSYGSSCGAIDPPYVYRLTNMSRERLLNDLPPSLPTWTVSLKI